ncbi:MAG: membrane protein insertion efficiency factor YidD [Candidatus Calescibacterium sp.]|nr:membrane protein insertion efficiency factor YidD [Candidatus Calescibacterium sp.]MCX7733941.1 membrane protein insertion efficiency factor YidD [bacterium]MDW8086461.1 membrane protein insertion efficiency factor YidD [Candidatus Calescibacterium sp.]
MEFLKQILIKIQFFVVSILVWIWRAIKFWGPSCRFYPSCSEYALMCAKKYPPYLAIPKIIWRILRCNPFSGGGVDFP